MNKSIYLRNENYNCWEKHNYNNISELSEIFKNKKITIGDGATVGDGACYDK
jgi:hypothetical protein